MMTVEQIAEVRKRSSCGQAIRSIAAVCCLSRNTVRKILRSNVTEFHRKGTKWAKTLITACQPRLNAMLESRWMAEPEQRITVKSIFQTLQGEGYKGSYDTILKYARQWEQKREEADGLCQ